MKNILPALLYYGLILPLSVLPLNILYILSDGIYSLVYRLIGYRKKVVIDNLKKSFPDKDEAEIERIAKAFYGHLCDLVVESIKGFNISKAELTKRYKILNPELADKYFKEGRSVVFTAGHYNNWEWCTLAVPIQMMHTMLGIYTNLASPYFDKKVLKSRTRFGMVAVPKKEAWAHLRQTPPDGKPTAAVFAIDQASRFSKRLHWVRFLGRDTAVMPGAEYLAKEQNLPVLFFEINKIKRGYYEVSSSLVTENPTEMPEGAISVAVTQRLEQQILKQPQYWLWTHKRWKRERKPEEPILG